MFQNIRIDGNATNIEVINCEVDKSYNQLIQIGIAAAVIPSNVMIDGCTLTLPNRQKTSFAPAIWQLAGSSGGDNLIIQNCTISSDINTDNTGNNEDGIIVADGDNILVERNTISDIDHVIHMRGSGV